MKDGKKMCEQGETIESWPRVHAKGIVAKDGGLCELSSMDTSSEVKKETHLHSFSIKGVLRDFTSCAFSSKVEKQKIKVSRSRRRKLLINPLPVAIYNNYLEITAQERLQDADVSSDTLRERRKEAES